jgi:hypothetical protein
MKHYFVFAAIQGALVGVACVMIFGCVAGLAMVFVMAAWGVRSAMDMVRDDQANAEVRRDSAAPGGTDGH